MKKVRIIMVMLVLLGMASLADAQIVVSQTTASTTKVYEKSGREKGFVIRPEMGLGTSFNGTYFNIHASFSYQFNPIFSMGIGTGLNRFPSSWYSSGRLTAIPLYANARVYFCDRKWSPFFDLKVGFNTSMNVDSYRDYNYSWSDENYRLVDVSLKGFFFCGSLGMQYKNFDFGCTVGLFRTHSNVYEYDLNESYHYIYSFDYSMWRPMLGGYVAYNFQFKKK